MIDKLQFQLRKNTVIAHWLFGILCAVVGVLFFPAALSLLVIFGAWEFWNDRNLRKHNRKYKPEGDMDWWDSFSVFCFVFAVMVILNLFNIVRIRWI
jgi:hypothetical protein